MCVCVCVSAVTVVPDELGAWLVQQRRWMNSANIMDLRQLFINLSWVNSKMRILLYIIQLLRWVEFNAGLGICFGKSCWHRLAAQSNVTCYLTNNQQLVLYDQLCDQLSDQLSDQLCCELNGLWSG